MTYWNTPTPKQREAATLKRLTQIQAGRLARELMGITQEQAALEIGVSYSTLRSWEAGRNLPRLDYWKAYKAWLIETLVAYASVNALPRDTELAVGSNMYRQRLGLVGHCARCAQVGHKAAHPRLRCKDVGCRRYHRTELSDITDEAVDPAI